MHCIGYRFEHKTLLDAILPAQSHWRHVDSWTAKATTAAQAAVAKGARTRGALPSQDVELQAQAASGNRLQSDPVGTPGRLLILEWNTALAFLERFLCVFLCFAGLVL